MCTLGTDLRVRRDGEDGLIPGVAGGGFVHQIQKADPPPRDAGDSGELH